MTLDPATVDRIYEAAVAHDRWPTLLQDIADTLGATGAVLLTRSPVNLSWIASPRVERHAEDFMSGEWWKEPHSEPLLRDMYPGFRCETDYRTIAEIEASRVNREFFHPRGLIAPAGTVMQGAGDDLLQLNFEGFATHAAARDAVPALDLLRPHLARAISLTSQLMTARAQATVESLALAGIAAAVVSGEGWLKASNAPFAARIGRACDTVRHRLRFADPFLDRQFQQGLAALTVEQEQVRSIATRATPDTAPLVVHMLPLRGTAQAVCDSDGILLIVADGTNASLPGADLLRTLFDLTPAEARLVRMLAEGATLATAAKQLGIAVNTARVHLRAAFGKTGVNRQAELLALLLRLGTGR